MVLVELEDGRRVVAKSMPQAIQGGGLAIEAEMLRHLAGRSDLPVPEVLFAADDLLLLSYIPNSGGAPAGASEDAADHVAALHGVTRSRFGHDGDTLIGPLPQPNPDADRWIPFYRDHRLLHMAGAAEAAGRLPPGLAARIDRLAARLDDLLLEPLAPSLLHGDLWSGNILVQGDRVAGFIDPAVSYGHPEIELAFTTLFNTFGERFFRRYGEHRPIEPEFFESRRPIYLLWPLLVHARLFDPRGGGSYAGQVSRIVGRFV